ncbi:MAG: pyrroline-5-carboxylate reductase [Hyphomicrobiales bacterium]|nr:pyrroline-5-carboxylate reductase [Hyphomicrobiales bacterium]
MSGGVRIVLIGAGRMGGALLRGWLATGVSGADIAVIEPHPTPDLAALMHSNGVGSMPAPGAGVIVLAVKPQMMDAALDAHKSLFGEATVALSIAAGRTMASIEARVRAGLAVVRAMPNTPAEIGRAVTAAVSSADASDEQKARCHALLAAVGDVVWLADEAQMDAVTAISGSGPAYLFHFVECLTAAAVDLGLPADVAATLARATASGAGELLRQSPETPARLRENVTSPGGTTAAALAVLMAEPGLRDLLADAARAAALRARELSA